MLHVPIFLPYILPYLPLSLVSFTPSSSLPLFSFPTSDRFIQAANLSLPVSVVLLHVFLSLFFLHSIFSFLPPSLVPNIHSLSPTYLLSLTPFSGSLRQPTSLSLPLFLFSCVLSYFISLLTSHQLPSHPLPLFSFLTSVT